MFSAVLANIRRLHFYCFPAFWPSRSCIFIIVARLGHFQEAAFLLFSGVWPLSGGCIFINFGRFDHFQQPAFLLCLGVWPL